MTITIDKNAKGRETGNCVLFANEKPFRTETFALMSDLPAFSKWDGYKLIFRPVGANVAHIRKNWPGAEWLEGTDRYVQEALELSKQVERTLMMKTAPLPGARGNSPYEYKRMPRQHQRRALLISWDKMFFALLMEQRTGKTKVVIDNAAYLYKLGKLHTLIVVSVNGVHRNWIDNEVPLDLPDWCPRETYFQRSSHTARQQERFNITLGAKKALRIFAFNIESFSRGERTPALFEAALGSGARVMLVVDESTRMKNNAANRTEYLIEHGSKAEYRRILTGTQAPEGKPEELFAQYKFLSPSILGYDTITAYRNHFCNIVKKSFGKEDGETGKRSKIPVIVPGCKNINELKEAIDGHSFRVRRAECMDLPPKIYKRYPVEMSKEQKRIYSELRDEYITEYKSQTLTAAMAITRSLRLQQILCGWWPMEQEELTGGETWKNTQPIFKNYADNPRVRAIDDLIEDNPDDKIIIWCRFRPDLEMIQRHLGKSAVSYHGGIKDDARAANYRAFQNDPKVRWFLGNQSCAGIGITLNKGTMQIYHSNNWSLGTRLQSEDRTEGDESKRESTLVVDLEVPGSIDTKILKQFRAKKDLADLINGDPKSIFLEEEDDD